MSSPPDSIQIARTIIDTPVQDELTSGFLAYSLSVIHSRAIPDVRDGLKPVQRRILYGMWRQRLRSNGNFRKSARVVGDVMGRYHPHGDSAIYDALVRLGQGFAMRVALVDPHGNFGSLDDPPAASRYTECRLTTAAEVMLNELDEGTVDFRPNYDGEETEPVYLPAGLPNLLINGTSGIAVGMATTIAPHNPAEVCAAVKLLIDNPSATVAQVRKVLPGPDFSTGGEIIGTAGIIDAYTTGKGTVRLRARTELSHTGRRHVITVTELPYQVGPERVMAKIGELAQAGRLDDIADIKDLSDRQGLRLVIDIKAGADPRKVLAQLCRLTPLEETIGINAIVLADGEPQRLGVRELLLRFIDHRLDVVIRRSRFRLAKAQDRAHLVQGLLIALDNIDAVVAEIKAAKDTNDARARLRRTFKLSDAQAEYILDMQLRRLTRLEVGKLTDELAMLAAHIDDLNDLLADDGRQRLTVASELDTAVQAHLSSRRTTICVTDPLQSVGAEPADADSDVEITLSDTGLIGRSPQGGWKARMGDGDVVMVKIPTTFRSSITAVAADGQIAQVSVADVPEVGSTRGVGIGALSGLDSDVVTVLSVADGTSVVVVTSHGFIKRLHAAEMPTASSATSCITLRPNDKVVAALVVDDNSEVAIVSSDAQLLRTAVSVVRPQGKSALGVAGMKLRDGAEVVGAWVITDDDVVVVASSGDKAKYTLASEFPVKGRATSGVRCMKLASDTVLSAAWCGPLQRLAIRTASTTALVDPVEARRDAAGLAVPAAWVRIGVPR